MGVTNPVGFDPGPGACVGKPLALLGEPRTERSVRGYLLQLTTYPQ